MVNPTFSNTPSTDEENDPTRYVIFDSSLLTNNRTVTFPDMNVKVVGEASSQTLTNKIYKGAIFADVGDDTRKISLISATLRTTKLMCLVSLMMIHQHL